MTGFNGMQTVKHIIQLHNKPYYFTEGNLLMEYTKKQYTVEFSTYRQREAENIQSKYRLMSQILNYYFFDVCFLKEWDISTLCYQVTILI